MRRLRVHAAIAGTIVLMLAATILTGVSLTGVAAGAAAPKLRLTNVADLPGVTGIAARTGTRTLYLAQQDGVVRSLRNGRLASAPVIDLRLENLT